MGPILCNYYITYRCNARCPFCNIWKLEGRDARVGDVISNLKGLRSLGVKFIDFTGGEPLMHPDLPEMLEVAKGLGFITSVTTNCILYPRLAESIRGKVDLLHFSIDSDRAELHDSIRGVKCFGRVMESLEIADKLGERPDLLFTLTDQNLGSLEGLVKLAQSLRLVLIVNPAFSYFGNPPTGKRALDAAERVAHERYVYVNRAVIRLMKNGGNSTADPKCRAVSSTVVISPDNSVILPCFHRSIGEIPIDRPLDELWKGDEIRRAMAMEGRYRFCEGCAISCYMDPSFLYEIDGYFWRSILPKLGYFIDKHVRSLGRGMEHLPGAGDLWDIFRSSISPVSF